MEVDESKVVNIELQPGEFSLHHVRIVHGSDPNNADYRRLGFAIRYVPTYSDRSPARATVRCWCAGWTTTITSIRSRARRPVSTPRL